MKDEILDKNKKIIKTKIMVMTVDDKLMFGRWKGTQMKMYYCQERIKRLSKLIASYFARGYKTIKISRLAMEMGRSITTIYRYLTHLDAYAVSCGYVLRK